MKKIVIWQKNGGEKKRGPVTGKKEVVRKRGGGWGALYHGKTTFSSGEFNYTKTGSDRALSRKGVHVKVGTKAKEKGHSWGGEEAEGSSTRFYWLESGERSAPMCVLFGK